MSTSSKPASASSVNAKASAQRSPLTIPITDSSSSSVSRSLSCPPPPPPRRCSRLAADAATVTADSARFGTVSSSASTSIGESGASSCAVPVLARLPSNCTPCANLAAYRSIQMTSAVIATRDLNGAPRTIAPYSGKLGSHRRADSNPKKRQSGRRTRRCRNATSDARPRQQPRQLRKPPPRSCSASGRGEGPCCPLLLGPFPVGPGLEGGFDLRSSRTFV